MSVLEKDIVAGMLLRIVGRRGYHQFRAEEVVKVADNFVKVMRNGTLRCNAVDGSDWWWVHMDDLTVLKPSPLSSHEILSDFESDITVAKDLGDKYKVVVPTKDGKSDVYDVLEAFNVTCQAAAHAIKKLLCAGLRGHKDVKVDKQEAINSIRRSLELDEHRK